MSRYSGLLERNRLQTYCLPPDKCVHILTAEQGIDGSTQVLYKKQGGSSGLLGGGSFGAVHLEIRDSECEALPRVRAVKTISKEAAETSKVHWQQEVENLLNLSKYPDLFVKIFGWWEDEKSIFLPMEYFELSDLSRNKDSVRGEDDIRTISQQLALGLQQMHGMGIIHRDIKPHNVFVVCKQPAWHVKIGDFGFSKRISDSVTAPFSARGTTKYMAPEYRDLMSSCDTSDYTTAVDMWSLGCLIYELFTKKCPFDEDNGSALVKYVRDGVFPRKPLEECGASSESTWLIMELLRWDPNLRLSAHDALHCAWLSTSNALLVAEAAVQDQSSCVNPILQLQLGFSQISTSADKPVSAPPVPEISLKSAPPALPGVVVTPDGVPEKADDSNNSFTKFPPRPQLPERAITSQELSRMRTTTDDTTLVNRPAFDVPELPPRPKSNNAMRPSSPQDISEAGLSSTPVKPYSISPPENHSKEPIRDASLIKIARKPVAKASNTPPQSLFPCIEATELSGKYIDMAFKNLKFKPQRKPMCDICESRLVFNPVVRPGDIYFCTDCGKRPLCQRCIFESIRSPGDPHEADHKLQKWMQAHSFPLQEFLERFQPLRAESKGGLDPSYGKAWLSSDHSFTSPAEVSHGTRWMLNAPAGEFEISVQVRVIPVEQAIDGSVIGKPKAMMVNAKATSLGSILFGAWVVDPSLGSSKTDDVRSNRHLPDRPIEQSFKLAKDEQVIMLKLGFKLKASAGQKIEVHIRGAYDVLFFKAGSPFKWWLDQISLVELGAEKHVASMGDLKMRQNAKDKQAKMEKQKKWEQGIKLAGQGVGMAGKINGVPNKMMFSAVSGALSLGGSVMKDRTSRPHPAAPTQQPAVYNNYYFSGDSFGNPQSNQQNYAEPEYEEVDDNNYSQEQPQQYLEDEEEETYYEQNNEWEWQQQQQQQIQQ